jgi:transcriptional regulator with XRE-family HTH domain
MAKKAGSKLDFKNLADYRKGKGLNQSSFWSRFGVTQSGGSRYESGRDIPKAVAMLIWLHDNGRLTDADLQDSLKAARKP